MLENAKNDVLYDASKLCFLHIMNIVGNFTWKVSYWKVKIEILMYEVGKFTVSMNH